MVDVPVTVASRRRVRAPAPSAARIRPAASTNSVASSAVWLLTAGTVATITALYVITRLCEVPRARVDSPHRAACARRDVLPRGRCARHAPPRQRRSSAPAGRPGLDGGDVLDGRELVRHPGIASGPPELDPRPVRVDARLPHGRAVGSAHPSPKAAP